MEVAGTEGSGLSFLALAADVEGAGVLPVSEGLGFSNFSLGFSFSLDLSASRSLGGSGRELSCVVMAVEVDMGVGVEWEVDVLAWVGLGEAREEGALLDNPEVGRLGEGALAPGMFRRFVGFGGVKARRQQ